MKKKLDRAITEIYKHIDADGTGLSFIAENRFIIDMYYRQSRRAVTGCKITSRDASLENFLCEKRFDVEEGQLTELLMLLQPDDEFLSSLHQRLVYACIEQLRLICCDKSCVSAENVIRLLIKSEGFDYQKIYVTVSKTERLLLKNDVYKKSEEKARAEYRRQLKRYAKDRELSPEQAAERAAYGNIDELISDKRTCIRRSAYFPLVIFVFLVFLLLCCVAFDTFDEPLTLLIVAPLSFSFYECAKFLIDYTYSKLFYPDPVMRLKPDEVSEENKTIIVITSLLSGKEGDDELFSHLEDIYNSNSESVFSYGVLADLPDHEDLIHPDDERIIENAKRHIEELNKKYNDRFYLFYRDREYSNVQGKFIVSERKRGAVIELSKKLYTGESKLYTVGNESRLSRIKYVITLDSDTQLPPGEGIRMVGVAAHPHNKPVIDEKKGTVISGHGIFQPNIATCLRSASATGFSLLTGGGGGFDSYASASYETYSQVFDEANFCGKGIFDVSCFYKCIPDAFEAGVILSHDLLEGMYLRCGHLNDVTLYDNTPSNALSYFKRESRWIRGDVQSLTRVFDKVKNKYGERIKNPLSALSKYKLLDNVRRALTPVFSFAAFLSALFFSHRCAAATSVFSVFYIVLPTVVEQTERLVFASNGIARKYYSYTLSGFWRSMFNMLCRIAQLPKSAVCALSSVYLSCVRLISGKHLLDWVSAAGAEKMCKNLPGVYLISYSAPLITGILVAIFVRCGLYRFFGLLFIASPFVMFSLSAPVEKGEREERLYKQKAREYAQQSFCYFESFVTENVNHLPPDNYSRIGDEPIAYRTSPTNIGLYMLSCLCACDLDIISSDDMEKKLSQTLSTVEKLKKYEGNLYNWYDIRTLEPLSDFVSSVDSGNFAVCLTALSSGLEEYGLLELKKRIDKLNDECKLQVLFDKKKQLFATGLQVGIGLTPSHYDIYMSEARSMYYFAAARGLIPPSAIGVPARILLSYKGHIGLGSWSGTCFEYFMPTLFLPVYKNSMLWESCRYAVNQQRECGTTVKGKYVFGISESCYYEFDPMMNYQYKAHGIPSLSLRYSPYTEHVISPYSSFLMMELMPAAVFENLERLAYVGCKGDYGFYEAIDCAPGRGSEPHVIQCYMAHHIGMSICAIANYCKNGAVRRRFIADPRMRAYRTVLSERVPTDEAPFKPSEAHVRLRSAMLPNADVSGNEMTSGVLSNTKEKIVYGKNGEIYLESGNISVTRRDGRSGFKLVAHDIKNTVILPQDMKRMVQDGGVEFSYDKISLRAYPHGTESAFCFRVNAESETAICFEPVMCKWSEYIRHISFSRLFITYEMSDGILCFCRKSRDGGRELYLCFTLCDGEGGIREFEYQTVFEKILPGSPDAQDLSNAFDGELYKSTESRSGPCVEPFLFCKCREKSYYAVMSIGYEKEQTKKTLCDILGNGSFVSPGENVRAYNGEWGQRILENILAPKKRKSLLREKFADISYLWKYGISGEGSLLLADMRMCNKMTQDIGEYINSCLLTYKDLLVCGIRYTVAFLFENDGYDEFVRRELMQAIKEAGLSLLVGKENGILLINEDDENAIKLISDAAFCAMIYPTHSLSAEPGVLTINKDRIKENKHERVKSFVYASKTLGMLTTRDSLGFTFYKNSHFGKLTRFDGDSMLPGGETVYLKTGNRYVDLCKNADNVKMSTEKTVYYGCILGVNYRIIAALHPVMPFKKIRVEFDGEQSVLYRCEFVLGEGGRTVSSLFDSGDGEKLIRITNAYSEERYSAFIYCEQGSEIKFDGEVCHLSARGKNVEFIIGAYENEASLKHYIENSRGDISTVYAQTVDGITECFELSSGNFALDFMFNEMAVYQAYFCRMVARCGFYQNGGAYGFRDQLQDSLALLYVKPEETRRQIYRCARHQYTEGDVMHWFHPVKEVGVRTRCSDDLLWLIYAVHRYVKVTNDKSILSKGVYYIRSEPLLIGEDDRYENAVRSDIKESIYMHCVRAAERSMTYGENGLPLFGSGDWNDGMNRVKGQSVWLGWFLCDVLERLAELSEIVSDKVGQVKYKAEAEKLRSVIEDFAYNGKYYIRGTYENGEIIGQHGGCNIDILPQAFAAFTGKNRGRISSAVREAYKRLYNSELKLVKLLEPAFDGDPDAGYISHYPAGIRENGGQYTHGAVWLAMALLRAGKNEEGYELLRAINPADRCGDVKAKERYGGETYVFAGDVYTAKGHEGRCGWSWYTGAAGWWYQAVLRELLGYEETGKSFSLSPCLSDDFSEFKLIVRKHGTAYEIRVKLCDRERVMLDGKVTEQKSFSFDGGEHELIIEKTDGRAIR